ncbi:hypothetical protein [Gilliamella sp. ESL0250]|nr:hypothetical protein [Gilliamella sp. ESL0250]NUF49790.1 hypothetical protein [Gilliamella sp. ESL0250]
MKKLLINGLLILFLAGFANADTNNTSLKNLPIDDAIKLATDSNDAKA